MTRQSTQHPCVLLVTATKPETTAVFKAFFDMERVRPTPFEINQRIYFDLGKTHGTHVYLTQSEMGSVSIGGSAQAIQDSIAALKPRCVVMVGIAFGIDAEKQQIGDILVSTQIRPYELQRVGSSSTLLRSDKPHASRSLISRFRAAEHYWDRAPVHFGVVMSGEKLVDDLAFRDKLLTLEPEAIGGEMEAAGLYLGCHERVPWILVKSICDWADGHKSTDKAARQRNAAANAASFVAHALSFTPFQWGTNSHEEAGGTLLEHCSLPPVSTFFGRERELSLIADAIAPESRGWGVLIKGQGGIGKTTLAVRAGYAAPPSHFAYKIFLSAKRTELTPDGERAIEHLAVSHYSDFLSELGRELGQQDIGKLSVAERASAVRALLAECRTLLIVDNVESMIESDQLRLFQFLNRLPGESKAIVTSRTEVDVAAQSIHLGRMELHDALELLCDLGQSNQRLANCSRDERIRLYELTGGNPLLICWTASQLGRPKSRCRTVADACNFLAENVAPDNDALEYVFGDIVATTTQSEVAVLSALSHFDQAIPVAWLPDVSGVPLRALRTALEDLQRRTLIAVDHTANSFQISGLVATYLKRHRPDDIAACGERIVARALSLVRENGHRRHDRFAILESNWLLISAAVPLMIGMQDNSSLQDFCQAIRIFLNYSGRWDDWLRLEVHAETRAEEHGDFVNAGWRAYRVGWIYSLRAETKEVLKAAARAEIHWRGQSDLQVERAQAIRLRGIGLKIEKDYSAARDAFEESLNLLCSVPQETEELVLTLNSLAEVERAGFAETGEKAFLGKAMETYQRAIEVAKRINFLEGIGIATGNSSAMALESLDYGRAAELATHALGIADSLGRKEMIASNCQLLSKALARQGEPDAGLPFAKRALTIAQELGRPDLLRATKAAFDECRGVLRRRAAEM